MNIRFDTEMGVLYIRIYEGEVVYTRELSTNRVFADYDDKDRMIGIEILDWSME